MFLFKKEKLFSISFQFESNVLYEIEMSWVYAESQFEEGGGGKRISIEGRSDEKDSNEKVFVKVDEGWISRWKLFSVLELFDVLIWCLRI